MKTELIEQNFLYLKYMSRIAPRFWAFACLVALSVTTFAQTANPPTTPPTTAPATAPTLDIKAKQDVLDGVQDILMKRAFVPGVDFTKWPTFLEAHRVDIDKTDTDTAFVRELNKVLKQFGV